MVRWISVEEAILERNSAAVHYPFGKFKAHQRKGRRWGIRTMAVTAEVRSGPPKDLSTDQSTIPLAYNSRKSQLLALVNGRSSIVY